MICNNRGSGINWRLHVVNGGCIAILQSATVLFRFTEARQGRDPSKLSVSDLYKISEMKFLVSLSYS